MEKIYDVVIIGGGPGGYTSALYCARAGVSTMVLEKLSAGGQMALTSQIDNYPGFEEGIDGFSLAEKMEQGAERFGAETELAEVLSVDFSNDIKIVESSEGTFKAKTVIIATGAVPRELGVPGEKELVGRGVGYCATCEEVCEKNNADCGHEADRTWDRCQRDCNRRRIVIIRQAFYGNTFALPCI